jgi:hypothetical protein
MEKIEKLIVRQRPRSYPLTSQQKKIKAACAYCGIKKGISRAELVEKMMNCIPQYFREH